MKRLRKFNGGQQAAFARAMLGDIARLANMDFSFGPGRSLTAGSLGGVARLSASFTPGTGARRPTPRRVQNMAIQQAGQRLPYQMRDRVTPEQTFDQSLHPSDQPTAASRDAIDQNIPPKEDPVVTGSRVQQYLLARFNPIRGLTPQLLSTYLEQAGLGFLRQAMLIWNEIRERDDQVAAVTAKRELRPTHMNWEIVPIDDGEEAKLHKEALESFYNSVTVTHALDQNAQGGVSLLIRQMMRAVGDKFSVHEIIWHPDVDEHGKAALGAELRWIPLWFFENRTGQLRFLPYELALQGLPLDPAGWLVHVSDGLFKSTSIAYLIKSMGLKYWANYAEKFGIPFLHAKTNAMQGSAEWEDFKTAVAGISSDGAILTSMAGEIAPIPVGQAGEMPQPALVDRMDRAISRLWSGGDLNTMSRGGGMGEHGAAGALPQLQNEDELAASDAARISESLNFYVDRWVIKYRFGVDKPLAKFVLEPPRDLDAQREVLVDTFLLECGVPMTVHDLAERYGRGLPDVDEQQRVENGEDIMAHAPAKQGAPIPGMGSGTGEDSGMSFGNVAYTSTPGLRRYYVTSRDLIANEQAKALAPVRERLLKIAALDDPAQQRLAMQKLKDDLPRMLKGIAGAPELVKAISDSLSPALALGYAQGARKIAKLNGDGSPSLNGNRMAGLDFRLP